MSPIVSWSLRLFCEYSFDRHPKLPYMGFIACLVHLKCHMILSSLSTVLWIFFKMQNIFWSWSFKLQQEPSTTTPSSFSSTSTTTDYSTTSFKDAQIQYRPLAAAYRSKNEDVPMPMIDIQLPFNNHSHIVTWLDPDKMRPKLSRDVYQVTICISSPPNFLQFECSRALKVLKIWTLARLW